MVLEKLGGSLREALRKIAGASYVDESLIRRSSATSSGP